MNPNSWWHRPYRNLTTLVVFLIMDAGFIIWNMLSLKSEMVSHKSTAFSVVLLVFWGASLALDIHKWYVPKPAELPPSGD